MAEKGPEHRRSRTMSGLEEAKEFRRLLRSGWRQIAACPNHCSAYLLEKDGEIFCVRCDQFFSEPLVPSRGSPPESSAGLKSLCDSALFQQLQQQMMQHSQSEAGSTRNPQDEASDMDQVSEELGKRMLAGWTLLAEHCPRCQCPLIRKGEEEVCVSCSVRPPHPSAKSRSEQQPLSEKELKAADEDEHPLDKFYGESSATGDDDDAFANLMGEYLLKGWTLLGYSCPNCNIPLLRDREEQMWCVKCKLKVVHEKDARKEKSPDRKDAGRILSPKQRPPKSVPETFTAGDPSGIVSQPRPASPSRSAVRALHFGETPRITSHTPGRKRRRSVVVLDDGRRQLAEPAAPRSSGGGSSPEDLLHYRAEVRTSTVSALLDKMEYFQKVLSQTSDPETCVRITHCLAELAQAVGVVQSRL